MQKLLFLIILFFSFLNNVLAELSSHTKLDVTSNNYYYYNDNNNLYNTGVNVYRNSNSNNKIIYYYYVKGSNPGSLIAYPFGSRYFQTDYNRPLSNGSILATSTTAPFGTTAQNNLCILYNETVTDDLVKHRYCSNPNTVSNLYYKMDLDAYKSNFYCTNNNEILNINNNIVSCVNSTNGSFVLSGSINTLSTIDNINIINNNKNLFYSYLLNICLYIGLGIFIFLILIFILFIPFYMAFKTFYNINIKKGKN